MGVTVDGQPIMRKIQGVALARREIHRLVHAAAHQGPHQHVEVRVVRLGCPLQGLGKLQVGPELELLEPLLPEDRLQLLQRVRLRGRMPAQHGECREDFGDVVGDRPVAQKHEFLDHLHHLHFLVLLNVCGVVGLAIHLELDLRRSQLQGPVGIPRGTHQSGNDSQSANALRELGLVVGVVVHGLRLVVGQSPRRANDGLAELHIHDLRSVGLDLPKTAETQPVSVANERA
mmetsp:Transcript_46766/g.101660  ORF Transcript_46766/g.101660 Transcript_46766/m.101660 type:complete len:231 (+) Transcript_46766:726-1418(+)